jgi:hypothetical protein
MPVLKFRTVEEWQAAKRALWLPCGHPDLPERIRAHWSEWTRRVPLGSPRGVRKYRSIEDMQADRERWEQERIDRIRAERLAK